MVKMRKGDVTVIVKDEKKQEAFEKHGFKVIEPRKKAKKEQEGEE